MDRIAALLLAWICTCSISLMPVCLYGIELESSFENSAIVSHEDVKEFQVYNRLRFQQTAGLENHSEISGVLKVDNNTNYQHNTSNLENQVDLYRLYLEYGGEKHFVIAGKQRVPFGVGRIWNPVDVFNPVNSFSVEPETRKGTTALRYEYAINELSNFDCTVSRKKSAGRLKSYLAGADLALVAVIDSGRELDIVGWEMEGELFETGVELRSEGGIFHDRDSGKHHVELIIGGEYGFENSVNILAEYLYNDEIHGGDLGLSAIYTVSMLLSVRLFAVMNFSDHSLGIVPSFEYSLDDDMVLSGSVFCYQGKSGDEFGDLGNQYVLRWFIHL